MKFTIIIFTLLTATISAQEVIPINLEKALELGGANNLTIKEYQARQQLSKAEYSKAKEWWLPSIYGGVQTHNLNGAVMNSNGKFFLDIERENLWLGLGLNLKWDIAEGLYSANEAKYNSRASIYTTEANRNNALLEVVNAYYKLVTSQLEYTAYKGLVGKSNTIVEQIQAQVDAGLRYQSEVLLAKSNKNHLKVEMLNSQNDYNTASAELAFLLNLDQNVKLVCIDSLLRPLDIENSVLTESALQNRPELKANELEIKALKARKRNYTIGLLIPEINLMANTSYFGVQSGEVTPIDPIAFPMPDQTHPTDVVNASLLWKIPLGALIYNGDNKRMKSLLRIKEIEGENMKAQVGKEISKAKFELQSGKEKIDISKEAMDLTTEALNQSIERQKIGTAKPFEVFQAQQFYLQARIDYLKSVGEYNLAYFSMKIAKGESL